MKKRFNKIKTKLVLAVLAGGLLLGGCNKYLDQAPEAGVNPEDAFKDFKSFQGFTEDCYNCIVDVSKIEPTFNYDLADENRMNNSYYLCVTFDAGNYWAWQTQYTSYFKTDPTPKLSTTSYLGKSTWWNSWYGIRVANNGLANLDKLVNATQEEKDLIKGQLLFFRGYFYFTLMRDWGGLPYIKKFLTPTDEMKYPRLNYQQTALKADSDFVEAAKLLPLNWDATLAGQKTLGNNHQRINKIMALSFQGKNLLYAASPLMNKESTGTAGYNAELCIKAADVFAQVINTCEQTTGLYSLQSWDTYSDMFYRVASNYEIPGGTEVIFNAPYYDYSWARVSSTWGMTAIGHSASCISICANYVKNWGMKNGLPISDPLSGYNPADPWANRDPRFYKTIVVDGDKLCNATSAGSDQYFQSYNGGRHRSTRGNITGFLSNKYWGLTCNKFDNGAKYTMLPPILRLSDIYLMYAEAVVNGYGTPQSNATGCITAVAAVNKVRARATVPDLDTKFTGSKDDFMEQLIVERAVELSFENLRWNDLRRWLKNGDPKYLDKTELLFDRNAAQKPINIQERLMVKRFVQEKHNWLPFPINYVSLYKEFKQNPGW